MSKKTLVIGASLKDERYSNLVLRLLKFYNHEVLAYGFKQGEVEEVMIQTELPEDKDINTVTMYINPERQKAYYQYLISLKPDRVIFNPGTENPDFYPLLEQANIPYEESCSLVLLTTNQY